MKKPLKLIGKNVYLEEIQPKYFNDVIKWRNDKEIKRFLNQPYVLNWELQEKWFKKYQQDDTQGLLVMVDKKTEKAFGTIGWTDLNMDEKICISGRLLVGNIEYRKRFEFIESMLLYNEYLYENLQLEKIYAYILPENHLAISFNKKFGYVKSVGECKFPKEQFLGDKRLDEFYRNKSQYNEIKHYFLKMIHRRKNI